VGRSPNRLNQTETQNINEWRQNRVIVYSDSNYKNKNKQVWTKISKIFRQDQENKFKNSWIEERTAIKTKSIKIYLMKL
jgi:hypothetical protein